MPLLWISIFFTFGLFLASLLPWSRTGWLAAAALNLLLWLLLRLLLSRVPPRKTSRSALLRRLHWLAHVEPQLRLPPILLGIAVFLGAVRMVYAAPDVMNGHISALNGRGLYRIQAVVAGYPDRRDNSTLLRLEVQEAAPLDRDGRAGERSPAHGLALVVLSGQADFAYGDLLLLEGQPATPPEDEGFSYREYLARQNIHTYLTYPKARRIGQNAGSPVLAAIYRFREWAYDEIYHLFPAPEAPLLAGILLGLEGDLTPQLSRAFQDTGTAHVIAISGFNIAILAGLFSTLFGRILPPWWALVLSIVAISAYTLLVGAAPSVVRAAIMGGLSLLAHQVGRRSAGLHTLFVTGGVMALQNPYMPWDASFQLSFGATAGLIVFGDRFQNGFRQLLERRLSPQAAGRITGPVSEYVLMTMAAQLMTLPVILFHFQRLSLSSLLANPLILPPQPMVMVLSGLAVLAGIVSDPLAHALAWLAWPFSVYTIRMVELLGSIPGGVLVLDEMGVGTAALLYGIILWPVISGRFSLPVKNLFTPGLLLGGALLATSLLLRGVRTAPDGMLHLTVLNVNHSQALLLQGPGGETIFINGGSSARLLNDALGHWTSPFNRRLDGLLINDPSANTVKSLTSVLDRYPPAQAWWGCALPAHRTGKDLLEFLEDEQVPVSPLAAGASITIGPARIDVLSTTPDGSALLISWDRFRALIPGGAPPAQFAVEHQSGLSLILLAPRDLKERSAEDWLALAPNAVIATPGEGTLPPEGVNWLNTLPGGWVRVKTDGERMWIEQSR